MQSNKARIKSFSKKVVIDNMYAVPPNHKSYTILPAAGSNPSFYRTEVQKRAADKGLRADGNI
jgi:hypothetical protein